MAGLQEETVFSVVVTCRGSMRLFFLSLCTCFPIESCFLFGREWLLKGSFATARTSRLASD